MKSQIKKKNNFKRGYSFKGIASFFIFKHKKYIFAENINKLFYAITLGGIIMKNNSMNKMKRTMKKRKKKSNVLVEMAEDFKDLITNAKVYKKLTKRK